MHLTLAGGSLWRKQMSVRGHKRAPVEHVILFLSSGDIVSEVWVIMSVEKRFRRCVDPCQRFLTPDDTHDLCVMCLGEEHARSVLEGMECAHCELFSLGKLRSRMSLFSRELGQSSAPRGSGPAADWSRGDRRWSSLTSLREELISRARQQLTSVNCWREMYCLLHLLIYGGYEACASARYTYSGGTKMGSGSQ